MRRGLEVFLWGCALLVLVQLPGAIFEDVSRQDRGPPIALIAVLAVLLLILGRVMHATWPTGWHALGAVSVALLLAAILAQVEIVKLKDKVAEVSDVGVLVPAPGRGYTDCRAPDRCHHHVNNELGFRGAIARRAEPDGRLVAVIGDSFVFGSGVGDDDTVPVVLAGALADLEPPVAVVNAGIQGLNGVNFPAIITYVGKRLHPDVIVVLLKDDDLDDTDVLSRWDRFRRSFWYRLLYVLNFETVYETARQTRRRWLDLDERPKVLVRNLNAIVAAAQGAKLVLLTELWDDVRPTFADWMAAHPDVVEASAWDDGRFMAAEQIPGDGHWTEAGCRQIAAIAAPLVRQQLGLPRGLR